MSFAFLARRQESGSTSALLSSIPDGIDNLIDVLDNTVNKRGGKEYDYGVGIKFICSSNYYFNLNNIDILAI